MSLLLARLARILGHHWRRSLAGVDRLLANVSLAGHLVQGLDEQLGEPPKVAE